MRDQSSGLTHSRSVLARSTCFVAVELSFDATLPDTVLLARDGAVVKL